MSQRIKSLLKAKEGPRWSLKGLPNKVDSEGNSTCKIFKFWMLVMLKKKKKKKGMDIAFSFVKLVFSKSFFFCPNYHVKYHSKAIHI